MPIIMYRYRFIKDFNKRLDAVDVFIWYTKYRSVRFIIPYRNYPIKTSVNYAYDPANM